jgi:NAD(P)-dependent dehydrogenase (short-subunit alcohol dehydrogenase family)/rhamnose utilization protein RhaD (predicted bifunctional aldolase and dehydrogenase)
MIMHIDDAFGGGEGIPDLDAKSALIRHARELAENVSFMTGARGCVSVKSDAVDFRGEPARVIHVSAAGADFDAMTSGDMATLRIAPMLALRERGAMTDIGLHAYLMQCRLDTAGAVPPLIALLQAMIPAAHVDVICSGYAVAPAYMGSGADDVREVFGDEAVWVPFQDTAFQFARSAAEAIKSSTTATFAFLERLGLLVWGESGDKSLHWAIRAFAGVCVCADKRRRNRRDVSLTYPDEQPCRDLLKAVAPPLRGLLSRDEPVILHIDSSDLSRNLSTAAIRYGWPPAGGAATVLGAGFPCLIEPSSDPARLADQVRAALGAGASLPASIPPKPLPACRGVVFANIGLITAGRTLVQAQSRGRFCLRALALAEAIGDLGAYRQPSDAEALVTDALVPEPDAPIPAMCGDLMGHVALVTGAGGGIGRAIARRLAAAGAHVIVTDVDLPMAERTAGEIVRECGGEHAVSARMDVTREEDVAGAFAAAVDAYGGVDLVVSNAGIAEAGAIERMTLAAWSRSLAINATGHFLVAREALRLFRAQGSGGAIVFVATKNVPAPGRDFAAYSAAKAAETQLARVAALEGAPIGVRVNVVHPDGIFEGSGLWSDAIRRERAAAHGVRMEDLEDFYRKRNLLQTRVFAEDVAEAVLFLAGPRSSKTTGAALGVDGGVSAAFPR